MPRPRKPTKVLELSGAFRKNPQRAAERRHEPKLPTGIGEPPEWLDTHALEEWWRIVPDLESAGVTSRVEATSLGAYCQAVSRLRKAEAEIFRDGITIMTESGLKKHPAVNIAERSMIIIRAFASEFGMTPASRSKVHGKPADDAKPANEFAAV
jgi:P27 family predicted phage terminase small subunit